MNLDLADIQGGLLTAYGKLGFPKGRVLLFHVSDPVAGRAFVERLRQRVTTALRRPSGKAVAAGTVVVERPLATLDIAFTFIDGMAARRRVLGDDLPGSRSLRLGRGLAAAGPGGCGAHPRAAERAGRRPGRAGAGPGLPDRGVARPRDRSRPGRPAARRARTFGRRRSGAVGPVRGRARGAAAHAAWLNHGPEFNAGRDGCPLVEARAEDARFVAPAAPGGLPFLLDRLPAFVETRGGDDFFAPSLTALRMIGQGLVDPT